MFATTIQLHPSLIFVSKAKSLLFKWYPVRGSTLVGSSDAWKEYNKVEMTNMANSLAYYDTNTISAVKSFIVHVPGPNLKELFVDIIYEYWNKLES